MGYFDNVSAAKVSKSGQYYLPGEYKVRVEACKVVPSTQKNGVLYFIVETTCLESDNPDIKEGGAYSQTINMNQIMGMPNIKMFVAAATGIDPFMEDKRNELNDAIEKTWSALLERPMTVEAVCSFIASSANPLEGVELGLTCVNTRTRPVPGKPEGGDFTKHQWFPLQDAAADAGISAAG